MKTRNYRLLHIFMYVAQTRSLSVAAEQLHLSAPVVSQALKDLEETLGHTLVQRGPRLFELTSSGERVYRHCLDMFGAACAAMDELDTGTVRLSGRVKLTLPIELAAFWLPAKLTAFATRYPDVRVDVEANDERVPLHGSDVEVALRAVHVRSGADEDGPAWDKIPLVLVGAPSVIGKRPLPYIAFSWQNEPGSIRSTDVRGKEHITPLATVTVVNNALVALEMCRLGMGAALLMEPGARTAIASGDLVPIHPRRNFGEVALSGGLRDPLPSPLARALSDFLKSETYAYG